MFDRFRRRAVAAVAVSIVVALLAGACSATGDSKGAGSSRHALQDIWMLTRMQAVTEDGSTVDVITDVLAELDSRAGPPVELVPELSFRPLPELAPMFVSPLGEAREDVAVVAGLFEVSDHARTLHGIDAADPGRTLGVVASAPSDGQHVAPGDLLRWDIFSLSSLAGIDTVLVDQVFAHSQPGSSEGDVDDPIDLLSLRWQEERVVFGGPEGGGDDEVAVFTAVPLRRGSPPSGSTTALASSEQPGGTVIRAVGAADSPAATRLVNDGPGGFMPSKSRPELGMAIGSALVCIGIGALAGPAGGVVITVICTAVGAAGAIYTVKNLLRKNLRPDPPPPPPRCRGNCVNSSGDPYLTTFKRHTFILHAAGEFTAVRTRDDAVDIQARMVPINDWVSVNSAVAARVGEHRVTIDADRDHVVYLDGQPLELDEFEERPLEGGGAVTRRGTEFMVEWPDSDTMLSAWLRAGIDYQIRLGPEHLAQATGLHGDQDGQRWHPDGELLPSRPSHDELHAYADAWRVTDSTSLFDYADGASTATYTDRNFPSTAPSLELLDPDRRAWAATICRAAGLTGFYLDACTVDLALTGDLRFVTSAVSAQADVAPEAFDHSSAKAAYPAGLSTVAPQVVWASDAGDNLVVEPGEELVVGAGIVLTQQRSGSGFDVSLHALDLSDGSPRWEADGFHQCRPVIVDDTVVALAADDNGTLVALDPRTGTVVAEATLASWSGGCVLGLSTTSSGLVLAPRQMVGSRTPMSQLRAFDVADDMNHVWSRDFDGDVLGYAATADDRIYVLDRRDGQAAVVHRLDPTSGATAASIELPITSTASTPEGALVALPGGGAAMLGQRADGDDVLVVLRDRGADLEVAWEFTFGADTGLRNRFPRLRAAGDLLVGWSGGVVGALDLRDGSVRWIHTPTSFQNNHGAIAASPSGVIIGPFGGAVMEVIGLDGTALSTLDRLGDVEELRQIGPVVDDQVIVRFSFRGREASIALVSLTG